MRRWGVGIWSGDQLLGVAGHWRWRRTAVRAAIRARLEASPTAYSWRAVRRSSADSFDWGSNPFEPTPTAHAPADELAPPRAAGRFSGLTTTQGPVPAQPIDR